MRLEKRDNGTTIARKEGSKRVLAVYYDGCKFCDDRKAEGCTFFPPHNASPQCESGRRNHCTCDTCF